ncbi:hypothetical protein GH733_011512 [Mirounga leonina]|nr:hypothetical protein GH733_011512 [Mirounga leonina]
MEVVCAQHQVNLIEVDDKKRGEGMGLYKTNREENPIKNTVETKEMKWKQKITVFSAMATSTQVITTPASPTDAQAVHITAWSTDLHFATLGFRNVSPSRCTSFTPSLRSRVWLLSGSLQPSRHSRTVEAANNSIFGSDWSGRKMG